MKRLGLLAALLVVAGGWIEMDDPFWVQRDIHSAVDPPGRYVHKFKGTLIERKIKGKRVQGSEGYSLLGTQGGKRVCYIGYTDARSRQHELAHCNGWPKDHRREGIERFHWAPPPPRQ